MRIKLEPFTESDIGRLIGWVPSEKFLRQWAGPGFDFPLGREQLKDHLAKAALENPDRLIYKAMDKETGEVVGHGEILSIDRQNRSATIGRILIGPPEMRGRGVGQQIVGELLGIAFRDLSLHRLVLRVFDFNKGAIRCYEKAGFKYEGLLRDVYKMDAEYRSLCVMSILEDEWWAGA